MINRRMTAKIDGDFVVFLIGARVNRWWNLRGLHLMVTSMPAMVAELSANPASGFLGAESWFGRTTIMVQYWRSMDQLMAYAHDKNHVHYPAWLKYNKELAKSGAFGIWHETYLIKAGNYECIYNHMPLFGLAKATAALEATGDLQTAKGRLNK